MRRPGLDAAVLRLRPSSGALRSRSTAPAGSRILDPRAGACSRCSRRRATSPARAARRSPSPTASTSATREAGDRLGAGRGDRGHVARLRGARHPGRLRQRLALQRDRRPRDPPDAGGRLRRPRGRRPRRPGRWRPGDAVLLAGAPALAPRRLRVPGALPRRRRRAAADADLARRGGSHLVPVPGRAACSACGARRAEGGLAVALAERALCSGIGAEVDSRGRASTRFGEGGGHAVVTCRREDRRARCDGVPLRGIGDGRRRPSSVCRSTRCGPRYEGGASPDVRHLRHPRAGRDVARLAYFGLFALQHRGQESAGIAVSDGGRLTALGTWASSPRSSPRKSSGASGPGGDRRTAATRPPARCTGRTRSRSSSTARANGRARPQRQPHEHDASCATSWSRRAPAAVHLRHRGDRRPRSRGRAAARGGGRRARWRGSRARTRSSSSPREARRLPRPRRHPPARARAARRRLRARLRDLRARPARRRARPRARPGELVVVDEDGLPRQPGASSRRSGGALCIFEFIYFARPDTKPRGVELHGARVRMGERLAEEAPAEADIVVPIPTPARRRRSASRARAASPSTRG